MQRLELPVFAPDVSKYSARITLRLLPSSAEVD